ncbi:MAG TPA: hydrogen peroxide-dependent heme synthase, partial [Actinomycetota bacterium]|nr:hydrogen peroxide-dependent heme synthase [Actinomycetota bacterium]
MSEPVTYTYFPVFRARPGLRDLGTEGIEAAREVERLEKEWADRVDVRGHYSTVGFRPDADLMLWWVAHSADDLQGLLAAVQRTPLGRHLDLTHAFMGVHRPPEVAKDHVPAFLRGEAPKRYLCVYPFDRSYEWYLLPREERADLLREHGEMGREFPDVLANTTSNFGIGDWEWILAFEADRLERIVDCIRRLREAPARRHTRTERPFVTGIR